MLWVSPVELSRNPGVTHMQVKGNVRQTRDVHREKLLIAILLPSYNAPFDIHDTSFTAWNLEFGSSGPSG